MISLPAGPHITQLTVENIKRVKAAQVTPDGTVIQLTGPNGAGKTSILDAIFWALGGTKSIDAVPVRRGEQSAKITLALGPVTVTRKFKIGEDGFTKSELVIKSDNGAQFPSPQKLLDDLVGELTFDPLAFDRMEPKQRLETLLQLVPLAIDLDEMARMNAGDYSARTDVGRLARQKEAERDAAGPIEDDAPAEPIDAAPITERIASASKVNAEIARERAARLKMQADIEAGYRAAEEKRAAAAVLLADADRCVAVAAVQADRLEEMPPLEPEVDTAELTAEVQRIFDRNAGYHRNQKRRTLEQEAAELLMEVDILTKRMADRNAERERAIAAATLPVAGLGFGEGDVLFNGLPYDQASSGERIDISTAIAFAMNPKLRVVMIRDASLLDTPARARIAERAAAAGFQLWMEVVESAGSLGGVTVVMEDGEVVTEGDS